MKRWKRLLSMLLVSCLLISMIPTVAFASDVVASGSCGTNVKWELDSDGILTISGFGSMKDYNFVNNESPWLQSKKIKEIIIEDGVTSIGGYAFAHCENLVSVKLGSTIKKIGYDAFNGCRALISIRIPDTTTTIGSYAFAFCNELDYLDLGSNVVEIEGTAFYNCKLSTVIVPRSLKTLGIYSFNGLGTIQNVYYEGTETEWKQIEGYKDKLDKAIQMHYNYNPKEMYYATITIADAVKFEPIRGVSIINQETNMLVGYTTDDGTARLCSPRKDFISLQSLLFSKTGYESFSCRYSDLLSSNGTLEAPSQLIYLTPIGADISPDFEKEAYIAQHVNFVKNNLSSMYVSHGFYDNVWVHEDGKRLWACNTWSIIGDIGEVASLKFDDLTIFADYYDIYLSDLILSLTENELNDRLLTKAADAYQDAYKSIKDNFITNMIILIESNTFYQKEVEELLDANSTFNKSYKEILADTKLLDSNLDKLLSGKEYEMDTSTKIIYNWFFGKAATDNDLFKKLFSGINEGLTAVNTILDVYTGEVELITDIFDAYVLTKSAKAVNKEIYSILYAAADQMEGINADYAKWFRRDINKYYNVAMDDTATVLYILADASFDLANSLYSTILRDSLKKIAYKAVSSALGLTIGELKLAVAVYNSTYKLLDLVTHNGAVTEEYTIINYIAPIEKALSNVTWQYGLELVKSQTYENAKSFDLAYNLLSETNKYLYDAAYKFEELRYNSEGTRTDDLEYATRYKNLWNTMKCHNAILCANSKALSIQCPVDVYLHDATGNTVLSIVDEKISTYTDDTITVLICNGKKSIIYPADFDYSITIIPREAGVMDYSVSEVTDIEQKRQVSFYDLPLEEKKTYIGVVPCEFNIVADKYTLVNDDNNIDCDYDSESEHAQTCLRGKHAFEAWVKMANATTEFNGYSEHICTACGFTEKNIVLWSPIGGVIPATGIVYTGAPQNGYSGLPTSAYTGDYEIHYTGRNDTVYNSVTPPINAGDYTVIIKIPDTDVTYTGSTSLDFTIGKAKQTAPATLELFGKTHNSVSLKPISTNTNGATVQYSKDGGATWQDSPEFTGLTPNTKYYFVAQYTAMENYEVSPVSDALNITTDTDPSDSGSTGGNPVGDGFPGSNIDGGSTETPAINNNTLKNPDKKLPFADVSESDWFSNAVDYVYHKNLMKGNSETQFDPYMPTTRAMIVTILYRLAGEPAVPTTKFSDVVAGTWYADAISWAAANSIIFGYSNSKFGPDDPITREQLASILYRYTGNPSTIDNLSGFNDQAAVSGYALPAMQWAVEKGIIAGKGNGIVDPQGNATRAEVAVMLMNYCEMK